MAYVAADWTIDRATGDIRYLGNAHNGVAPSYATVIEAHRAWSALADDASSAGSDDELDITDNTPSDRSTDNIVTLNQPYNIDATAAEHLYDGSIIQTGGAEIYDGIVNFGNGSVQIQIIQNGALITNDYWNTSIGGSDTSSTAAATMTDTGASFTIDEYIGYTIYNTTTGAQGIISTNSATVVTADMYDDNGTDHTWDSTDTYLIGAALNSNSAAGISARFMVRTRTAGVDIDGRRLLGTARRYGNTYGEFKINGSSRGNNVLALSDATDLNNGTSGSLIQTYDQFVNDNVGFDNTQDVDLSTVNEEYYSRWDIGGFTTPASPTINDLYEWAKWVTRQSSDASLYGLNGELFRGITLDIAVDTPVTTVDFSAFGAVSWTGGTGQLLAIDNVNAPTQMWIQLLTGVAPTDNQVIASVATPATTATVNITITDRESLITKPFIGASTGSSIIGGYGIGIDSGDLTASDILFDLDNAQITPPNNVTVSVGGLVSGEDYVTVTQRGLRFAYDTEAGGTFALEDTLTFSGAATATALLAEIVDQGTTGYMICSEAITGSLPTGATADNAVITVGAVTAAINGSVNSDTNKRQLSLLTTLSADAITSVVVNEVIPTDTPASGVVRVQDNNGFYRRLLYTSYLTSTFTISNPGDTEDNFNSVNATGGAGALGRNVYIGYKDELADATTESFTTVYSANRNLFVRVRDGGTAGDSVGIKTFESTVTMTSSGGSATAIRTSDA
ncbi:MAG: hypothetical protein ACI8V7_000364 [Candidatus Paceibacteria bacterium]|jgi:hypothetical protein